MPQEKVSASEYVRRQRARYDRGEIDLHEYGRILRDVAPYLSLEELAELGGKRK